jgi:hypothetical protein
MGGKPTAEGKSCQDSKPLRRGGLGDFQATAERQISPEAAKNNGAAKDSADVTACADGFVAAGKGQGLDS